MKSKILLLLVILFCVAITSNAQINKGKILLGGNFGYSRSDNNTASGYPGNEYLSSGIQIGRAVKENAVIGLTFFYTHIKYLYASPSRNETNSYNAGLFYRRYKKLAKDFYLLGEINGSYFHSENPITNYPTYTETIKSNGGTISFVPGLSYAIFRKLQVELLAQNILGISYTHTKTIDNFGPSFPIGKNIANNFGFYSSTSAGFLSNFGIGFKFFL